MLSFKLAFSLPFFTFIKKLFSSSSLSAYLRLFIFLPAVLIPACASSSLAFHMMCSAYKLNKQGDNIQPCTPFPIWNPFVPCLVLTVASWPAYRFLRRQVGFSGISISLWIFYSMLWSTQSKVLAESIKQMFFCNSLAFCMIQWILAIWSLVPLPFLYSDWISGSSQFTYCWSLTWRTLSIALLACEMSANVW